MDKKSDEERIKKLRDEINYHRYLYHVLDRQDISDAALDSLKHELYTLEQKFPDLITPDSPTQRVGGRPLPGFKKVRHEVRMISLNDAFSEEELKEWETRIKKLIPHEKDRNTLDYFAEVKGDGFAISLLYKNRLLDTGSTRGDGLIGEDVTENLKTIEAIPLKIISDFKTAAAQHKEVKEIFNKHPRLTKYLAALPKTIEVRGEVYMDKKSFEAVNREQKKKGLLEFANPRNIAAGSVRQLDPRIAASRRLNFFSWDLVTDLGQKTHEEEHLLMKILGFPTVPLTRYCQNIEEVIAFWKGIYQKRETLPFLIDGIVVQVNNGKILESLGVVGKAPRGAIAFKFSAQESVTVVEDISVQVGRTGVLTPVATLRPVKIGGVTVTHATLHNMDEIKRLDVRIGDTVIVERAGDVIPAVTAVLKKMRPKSAREFHMPRLCPICGSPAIHKEGEVAYYCSNRNCAAIQREKIYHFVSRKALDIQGLGPKIIDAFLENGLIKDAADIFTLKKEDVEQLERFAEKSASNIIAAIEEKRRAELGRFIFALGIRHVGEETALDLARRFGSLKNLQNASLEKLQDICDIGEVVAKSIYEWFRDKNNRTLLKKFKKAGLTVLTAKIKKGKLSGKNFVLTGGLETVPREEAKARIRELGGNISESVGSKTDYVIAGSGPGSKLGKARKLGVKIIDEKEFLKLISY